MSDQEKFFYALNELRMYNKIIRYGLPKESFSIPEIEAGLLSSFNSKEEEKAINMLIAASTEAIMNNSAIPKSRRERQARKNADEIKQAWQIAKANIMPISVPEREELLKKNRIAKRAAYLKKAERFLKRKRTKMAINAAATSIATLVVGAPVSVPIGIIWGVITLMPEEWKQTIKKKAVDWTDRAATTIENTVERFKKTPVGQRLTKSVDAIKESKLVTTIKKITNPIGRTIVNIGKVVNKGASKFCDFVKSFF